MTLQTELLEQSFAKIKPQGTAFVATFYEKLFIAYPETKPLFEKTDLKKQEKKLLNSLVLLVESLHQPELLKQILNDLGARHKEYGTLPQYYPLVGKILLETFADYLQQDWTEEVKQAWTETYNAVTQMMLEGAGIDTILPQSNGDNTNFITEETESELLEIEPKISITTSEPTQIELVEQSFAKIKPQGTAFVATFYEKLFIAYPETKPLFAKIDIKKQEKKLLNSLVLLVESLHQPELLKQILNDLGARHKEYGTLPQYYPLVGKILLETFADYLQQDWTEEVKQAWTKTYNAVTQMMLEGATNALSAEANTENKALETEPSFFNDAKVKATNKRRFIFFSKLKAKLQKNRQQINVTSLKTSIASIFNTILKEFWELPTWSVAVASALIISFLYLIADDETLLSELLTGTDKISLFIALILYIKETPDRKKEFHYQAWSIIDNANGVKVSYARILALQDLNSDRVPLKGLSAPDANLANIDLHASNLSDANLTKANLKDANLAHANLSNALLSRVNFTGANLAHANLGFAKLSYANLSSANLKAINLVCADLRDANLSGVDLRNANLSGADLKDAYLTGANLQGAKVSQSDLKKAYLKGATMPDGTLNVGK